MLKDTHQLAKELGVILSKRHLQCAVAESCTGGSLSAIITEIPGCSRWFDRAFITYSNEAKEQMLNVPHQTISSFGAVSEQTAQAMAEGVIACSAADVSVAITGLAGPSGGCSEKPVGTVWIAWAGDKQLTFSACYYFKGNRFEIRQQAVAMALQGLIKRCSPAQHPALQEKPVERYFFALLPPDTIAHALYSNSELVLQTATCRLTIQDNLHLTLVYLGHVHSNVLTHVMRMAKTIQCPSFELKIDALGYWNDPKLCWLGLNETPGALINLVACLRHALIKLGFKPEKREYKPHITIARDCKAMNALPPFPPIMWHVRDFCLLKSNRGSKALPYEVVSRWLLQE